MHGYSFQYPDFANQIVVKIFLNPNFESQPSDAAAAMMLRDQFQTIPLLLCLLSIATIKTEKSPLCIDLDVDCPEYELTATHEIDGVKFEIRDYPPMRLLYTRLEYLSMNFTFNEGSEKLDEYTAQLKDDNGTQLKVDFQTFQFITQFPKFRSK